MWWAIKPGTSAEMAPIAAPDTADDSSRTVVVVAARRSRPPTARTPRKATVVASEPNRAATR